MTGACAVASAPLLSTQWFRVAALTPRIDARCRIERQVVRGEVWHVLVGADGVRSFRLNAAAWRAVARCDGRHTVQRAWDVALAECGDAAPTQDEFLSMLTRLQGAGLVSFDDRPDFGGSPAAVADGRLDPPADATDDAARRNQLLAWRFPLGDPGALLDRLLPRLRWLFSRWALAAWVMGVSAAALAGASYAAQLAAQWHAAVASPHMAIWALVLYPLVKAVHEAAHGLVARRHGARVCEWGVTLLMFVPVPYVDASASAALPRARQRIAVAGAGIAAELGLAAIALFVALQVQPGPWRDGALAVFFVGAVSTLVVNANPLLRFDGYYMACDALGLPNLAARSRQHWLQQLQVRVLHAPAGTVLVPAAGERPWLWVYAPAALAMRWVVALAVVFWLAKVSFVLGLLSAAVMAWSLVLQPARALATWWGRCDASAGASPLRRRAAALAGAVVLALGVLPFPDVTIVRGILWVPEKALLRTQVDGFVDEVFVTQGQPVRAGDAMLRLRAPALHAERERLVGRIEALRAEQAAGLQVEPARAAAAAHELQAAQGELGWTDQRLEQLVVRAADDGRVAIAALQDLPGRYLPRGTLVGHLVGAQRALVHVAIPQAQAAHLGVPGPGEAARPSAVAVRLADPRAPVVAGRWAGVVSGAGAQLPSAALGERSGGPIETDPADARGLRARQPVVVAEVALDRAAGERIGERVHVRIDHGHSPLAWQGARTLQQQVLGHFNPAQ